MIRQLAVCFVFAVALVANAQAQFSDPTARTRDGAYTPTGFGWNMSTSDNLDSRYLQPGSGSQPNWRFGVYVTNSETGALVTRVEAGSAAERSGVEVGDIIIAINGFQVGYINGTLFDVGDEIRRRVNAQGQVSALIWDRRTAALEKVNINLQSNSLRLAGQVTWRDRQMLPNNAILQLKVVNLTRPYTEIRGGSQSFAIYRAQPVPFEMNVDPQYLSAGDRYQLQAAITSGGATLYLLTQPIAIDFNSNLNQRLNLDLTAVNSNFSWNNNSTGSSGGLYMVGYPPVAQDIVRYYKQYLGRDPYASELNAWIDHLNRGRSITDLPVALLNSVEFYDLAGGNDAGFVTRMFQTTVNRSPTNDELNRWLQQFSRTGGRAGVVRDFLAAVRK